MTNTITKWAIYAVALATAIAAGTVAIAAIHASMLNADDSQRSDALAQSTAGPDGLPVQTGATPLLPAALPLLATQGWVRPELVDIYDPDRKEDWLPKDGMPAEIAIVPAIESDTLPMQLGAQAGLRSGDAGLPGATTLGPDNLPVGAANGIAGSSMAGLAPPPPLPMLPLPGWGPSAGLPNQPTTLERGQVAEVDTREDALGALIGEVDGSNPPGALPPSSDQGVVAALPPTGGSRTPADGRANALTLAELTERECADAGFFSRYGCEQRVKESFCEGRWGAVRECRREETVVNF